MRFAQPFLKLFGKTSITFGVNMSPTSTPAFTVPSDLEERIKKQIDTGVFADGHEVLREALDTLEHRQRSMRKLREMIDEADEAIANGRVGVVDRDELKREVREMLAKDGITD